MKSYQKPYISFLMLSGLLLSQNLFSSTIDCKDLSYQGLMQTSHELDTSGEKTLYTDEQGNRWFVKHNALNLVINEYVASKLYGFISGPTNAKVALFVCDSNIHIATELLQGFHEFKMFKHEIEGFRLEDAGRENARFHGKSVSGLAEALYGTLLNFDDDIKDSLNFALVEREEDVRVVRFDFDDSFKFYDSLFITEIALAPSIAAHFNALRPGGAEFVRQSLKRDLKYWDPSFFWLFDKMPALKSLPGLPSQLRQIHDSVFANQEELMQVIDEAYETIAQNIPESRLRKAYNFKKLRAVARSRKIAISVKDPLAKQLANFTKGMIAERLNKLEDELPTQEHNDL